jgi:uncharacterized protein involved in tolerance to divalent cations
MTDLIEVRISVPDEAVGQALADSLVAQQLAACVQLLAPMTSTYRWQGEVEHEEERLLLAKSTASLFAAICTAVRAQHPYETPEILAVPILEADPAYAAWLADSVSAG